ncbi:hypothetical protein ACSW8S_16520 (plasmid) [Clostridium perfringens]
MRIKILRKFFTKKLLCFRCKTEVEKENKPSIDAPYHCLYCDEDMYAFETICSPENKEEF